MEYIRNITIFMLIYHICSLLIVSEGYKKYLKLITGMILILIVLQPLKIFTDSQEIENDVTRKLMNFGLGEEYQSVKSVNHEIEQQQLDIAGKKTSEYIRQILTNRRIVPSEVLVTCRIEDEGIIYEKIVITTSGADKAKCDYIRQIISENLNVEDLSVVEIKS